MNDKELLELAAKAAGIKIVRITDTGMPLIIGKDENGKHWDSWNPLTDDGDALRLAVQLRIDLEFGQEDTTASVWTSNGYIGAFQEKHVNTRRAIVRAAAEIAQCDIGKGMK